MAGTRAYHASHHRLQQQDRLQRSSNQQSTRNKPEQDPIRRDSAETIEGDESATIYTALDLNQRI